MPVPAKADIEPYLTVTDVAERLKINEDTVRRLFGNEPGVLVICFAGGGSTEPCVSPRASTSVF